MDEHKDPSFCPICEVKYPDTFRGFINHVEGLCHRSNLLLIELRKLIEDISELPAFGSVHSCSKCASKFHNNKPSVWYNNVRNIMRRTCQYCGFYWEERCADGSEPKNA